MTTRSNISHTSAILAPSGRAWSCITNSIWLPVGSSPAPIAGVGTAVCETNTDHVAVTEDVVDGHSQVGQRRRVPTHHGAELVDSVPVESQDH
jgi:hypothetical protein